MAMQAAIQPFIDAAISKTVNVAEDYPFEDFEGLYLEAWRAGLKGITTYRPNSVLGSVLSIDGRPRRRRISTSPSRTGASASRTRRRWRWRRCAGRTGRS